MENKKLFSLIGLICSGVGCFLTVLFSIITCSRGYKAMKISFSGIDFKMSNWVIGVVIAVIIAIVGVVFSILSWDRSMPMEKMTKIAVIVGCVAIVYGIVTNATICSYNCSLNSAVEDEIQKQTKKYSNGLFD